MNAFEYLAPKTVKRAAEILSKHGDKARILAGGTDILVQMREGRRHADVVVDVKGIPELNRLLYTAKGEQPRLTIGAAVPCYKVYENKTIARAYPGLVDAISLIGGIQIQSRASLGGNLCNASPAADAVPALIAHEAVVVIATHEGTREVPVDQFCTGPGRTVLQPGEFVLQIYMPGPKANSAGAYLRFIPRNEMDIAVVGVGVQIALDETLKRCTAARVALGAVAPTPLLVPAAGAALLAGEFNESAMDQAAAAAQAAAKPITDMRGTAEYRKHLVGILVKRALQQAFGRIQQAASKKKPLSSSASKEPSTDQPTTPPEPHAPQES